KERSLLYAPAYQRERKDRQILSVIREKAPLLFPQFDSIEAASVASEDEKGNTVYKKMLALVSLKNDMPPEETTRFQGWLNAEAGMPVVVVYQIVPTQTTN
ncbi:MAG: DUF389 domain-containing protein, partial [Selenomonadaceae bacterium]|nr:DUF389 domain-containing protein [Selenomonadaceae bacterium]